MMKSILAIGFVITLIECWLCYSCYRVGFSAGSEAAGQTANGLLEAGYTITDPEGGDVEWFTDDPKATPPAWVVARRNAKAK